MDSTAKSSAPDLLSQAHEIFSRANALQLHDPATDCHTPAARAIRLQALQWLASTAPLLPSLSAAETMELLNPLDYLHRIARSEPAPDSLLNPLRLKIFNAYIHGDSTLDVYDVFTLVDTELRRHNRAFFGKPLAWHSLQISTWLRNFRNPSRPKISGYDLHNQARLLLQTELTTFLPNPTPLLSALPSYL